MFPDQPVPRNKINPDNTSQMVRACGSQPPEGRFQEIGLASAAIREDSRSYLQDFHIEIDDKPLLVPGRVLEPPKTRGLNTQFHAPKNLENWCVINFDRRVGNGNSVEEFVDNLRHEAQSRLGMTIQQPRKLWKNANPNERNIVRSVFRGAKQECGQGLQLIMFIIPDNSPIYSEIKLTGKHIF